MVRSDRAELRLRSAAAVCLGLWTALAAAPAAAAVEISAKPKHVVLGGKGPQKVKLTIRVTDAGGNLNGASQLIVRSTAGKVERLESVAPGRFRAVLSPPEETFPQLAVITAANVAPVSLGEAPEVAIVGVAYSARIDLKGKTEPGARMKVTIAKKTFGPVKVKKDGRFSLKVVVPPGVGWGDGVSTDKLGNASRSKINLYLPEVRRLHAFAYPEVLIADGNDRGWLFVTTVDTSGAPQKADISVLEARGSLGVPERVAKGLVRMAYIAPAGLQDGHDELVLGSEKRRVPVRLGLMAGPPTRVELEVAEAPPADGKTITPVTLKITDDAGNPALGHEVALLVGEAVLDVNEEAPAVYVAQLPARKVRGKLELSSKITPRSPDCHRPTVRKDGDVIRIVDVRGIPCRAAYSLRDSVGRSLGDGELTEEGVLPLGADLAPKFEQLLLDVHTPSGSRPVVRFRQTKLFGGGPAPIARTFAQVRQVEWRLPTGVDLRIRVVERTAKAVRLVVETEGVAELSTVVVNSSRGEVTTHVAEGRIAARIAFPGHKLSVPSTAPLDVVATDRATGVATWLRVE